ncbi:MAG: M14 family zinc carboxypeptidase [Bryobacteraceae bacterium]
MRAAFRPLAVLVSVSALAAQPLDEGYTRKIREATTSPMFLTELVDHLPASPTVPTPEMFLGYIAGAENRLTYAKDVHRYMRELARTSPRVRVLPIGQTEEGREMILVLVSSEENLKRLDRLKQITAHLADPRRTPDAEAEKLISEGVPFYWATGAIHSPETGSPEMLMELAYRLAVTESPFYDSLRRNLVIMITPVIEVDGRERMVDLYRWRKANPDRTPPPLLYWGRYVAHDNNRDGIALALALSRNINRAFLEFHPQVVHDLHESVPFLYTSTGMGPYNAWLDPIEINEWQKMAWHEVEEMTKRGVPGVWTWGFYDGWGANYMMQVAHGHNAIGRFYETFGNGGADTRERTVPPAQTQRAWYRPNPPLPRVKWSQRNNVNLQQSALLIALDYAAKNREHFLRNFWLKSKRSVAKAVTEGPAAYVIHASPRPNEAASLVAQLMMHGVEVHRLDSDAGAGNAKFARGSYLVRMDQPYSRLADMFLDRQYYSPNDTQPYDDTGWTLGALRNVPVTRVTDASILKAAATLLTAPPKPEGGIEGQGNVFLLTHNADRALATFRFRLRNLRFLAAEKPFEAAGMKFPAGSFIIPADGNPANLRALVEQAAREVGLKVQAVAEMPKTDSHPVAAPRIALVHTWTNTQNEGWFRLGLESTGIPYDYISVHTLRDNPNLREKYDVIVLGHVNADSRRLLQGIPKRGGPIPWRASELTPNIGTSPDQTDDIRGGIELEGLINIRRFVEEGGLFVTIAGNSSLPIDFGLVDGVTIEPARELRARGSVLNAEVADPGSPVMYGYEGRLPVYFNTAPVFNVSLAGGLGRGPGGQAGGQQPASRPSGRGGLDDPDVVQGRPPAPPAPPVRPGEMSEEMMEAMRAYLPPPQERPRVLLRFAGEKDLLVSGMLAGGRELAGRPALIDVPRGRGHYLLFAMNPMWRQQTQGSFMLLLNAAMHFEHLNAGRPAAPARQPSASGEDDFAGDDVQ